MQANTRQKRKNPTLAKMAGDVQMENKSEIILYQTEDGISKIEVRLDNETVWLTQSQMAELFQTTKQNVSLHIKNIFDESELHRMVKTTAPIISI